MAIAPSALSTFDVKDVELLELEIDKAAERRILPSGGRLSLTLSLRMDIADGVARELRRRYLAAGWKLFAIRNAGDDCIAVILDTNAPVVTSD